MLTIGSYALINQGFDIGRKPIDIDYICTLEDFGNVLQKFQDMNILSDIKQIKEDLVVLFLNDSVHGFPKIQEFNIVIDREHSNHKILEYCSDVEDAPLDVLLLLKLSHRYKKNSPHFLKTMRDIQFLRSLGAKIDSDVLRDILKLREKETYNYKHPKLMQKKETFFELGETFYKYDHDDIHVAVATLDKPAYLYFKPTDSEVMVSKKMWLECSYDIQLRAGLEESYVLALERSLIPLPGRLTPKQAFDIALMKVCTSITSGWFREFCWENYDAIQGLYDDNFVMKFNLALEAGKIGPFIKAA